MTKLVSILIPAYNAEKWIAETIESALNQTWAKKEIIIVDDGSSDNTYHIAKRFQSKSVKICAQKNSGASSARNKAFLMSQGDYIQWLDADDLIAPDKIEIQMEHISKSENSMIINSSSFGEFYYRKSCARFITTPLWQDLKPIDWISYKFNNNIWMNPAVWLTSRSLIEKAGIWDERLSLDDDGEYFARTIAASELVKFIPEAKAYYRRSNVASLSRSRSYEACRSLILSLKLSFEYLLRLEDSERTRQACLNYLQIWFIYVYPEKTALIQEIYFLAERLGGKLEEPKLGKKYYLFQKIFGWQTAKFLSMNVPKIKLVAKNKLDYYLFNFQKIWRNKSQIQEKILIDP